MSSREIHLHIRITRSGLIALAAVVALTAGAIVFGVVGTRGASAATGKRLCVTASGTVVQRTKCLVGERTLAAGKYRTRPLPATALPQGDTTMPEPGPRSAEGREGEEPPTVALSATEMFESGVYAYTVRYDVPASWVGSITGTCPDWAPMFIANGSYSPEWAWLTPNPPWDRTLGAQLKISRSQWTLDQLMILASNQGWPVSPDAPFTLYVTQVCGSIVALNPTG